MTFMVVATVLALSGPPFAHITVGEVEGNCGKSFAGGSYSYRCDVHTFVALGASREQVELLISEHVKTLPKHRLVRRKDCGRGWAAAAKTEDGSLGSFSCGHESIREAITNALHQCRGEGEFHRAPRKCLIDERTLYDVGTVTQAHSNPVRN